MTIAIGQKIPSLTLKITGASGLEDITTDSIFQNKKVLLFTLPGAFTPPCSGKHLPGYLEQASTLKSQGIDTIVCMAVNDPFTMKAWADANNVGDKILMLPDGNAALTKALGLDFDASGIGLGTRAKRSAMIVENGVVKELQIENAPSDVELSAASCMVDLLKKKAA